MKKYIIFICNGNIHRSVIAAACLRKIFSELGIVEEFSIESYGLQGTDGTMKPKYSHLSEYPEEWNAARPTLARLGIDISQRSCLTISPEIMQAASTVIAMDQRVYSEANNSLVRQFPNQMNKIHLFSELTSDHSSIPDPAGSGDEELHRNIIETIFSALSKNYGKILSWTK